MYTYLLYDANKNPIAIEPSTFNITSYVRNNIPDVSNFDINDAVHLFNSLFSSNEELLIAIISEYNRNNPDKKLDTEDYYYVHLVTKRYENIYGLPQVQDYRSNENIKAEERVNIVTPIIYKEDFEFCKRFSETEKLNLSHLCSPDLRTLYFFVSASLENIDFTYSSDPSKKNFMKSLYTHLFNIVKQRYQDVTNKPLYKGSIDKYLLDQTFNERCRPGDIFCRTVIDEILFFERTYTLYKSLNRDFVVDLTNFNQNTTENLLSFSWGDLRNFKNISENFPKTKKDPINPFTLMEMRETERMSRINSDMDSNFTIGDLDDNHLSDFFDNYSNGHDRR